MKIALSTFRGIAPRLNARSLPDDAAQVALNVEAFGSTLVPIAAPGDSVTTLSDDTSSPLSLALSGDSTVTVNTLYVLEYTVTGVEAGATITVDWGDGVETTLTITSGMLLSGPVRSIYRFGQDLPGVDQYWLAWSYDVDVCLGQIAGDTAEWTFYTDYDPEHNNGVSAYPKATSNSLALSGNTYPTNWRRLGLPSPSGALLCALSGVDPAQYPAKVTLGSSTIAGFSTSSVVKVRVDNGDYTRLGLSDVTASGLATAIDNQTDAVATAIDGYVEVESPLAGPDHAIAVAYGELMTTVLYAEASGAAQDVPASVEVDVPNIYSIKVRLTEQNNWVTVYTASYTVLDGARVYDFDDNATIVDAINNSSFATNVTASVPSPDNGHVIIETDVAGAATTLYATVSYATGTWPYGTKTKDYQGTGLDSADTTTELVLGAANLAVMSPEYDLEVSLDGSAYTLIPIANNAADTVADAINASALAVTATSLNGRVTITRDSSGPLPIYVRYDVEDVVTLTADGGEEDLGVPEARVYTYTWIATEDGLTMESGPAPPSQVVDAYDGQLVTLTNFDSAPSSQNVVVTGKRIYRAVNGVYLLVDEIGPATAQFVDNVLASGLGEEMPSISWSMPPDDLRGLINLPGGMMAGFRGQDVYFCEPYRPYAWPNEYIQTVDAPVVGLGRMDTTLAVLTKGNPYFMQGSSPDLVVPLKSDIEQACVSKRSIVSVGGGVIYASPDGLVFLSPGGSRVMTTELFDAAAWNELLIPSSIHAYSHDRKYVAFFNTPSGGNGGFVLDVDTRQFTLHDMYYRCGYTDLRADQLFLATELRTIVPWQQGTVQTGVWRSKKFSLPGPATFSCAQVEAEGYPLTCRILRDGSLVLEKTVLTRDMFRLPPGYGRDWEVELETNYEVFNVVIAQSPSELASA